MAETDTDVFCPKPDVLVTTLDSTLMRFVSALEEIARRRRPRVSGEAIKTYTMAAKNRPALILDWFASSDVLLSFCDNLVVNQNQFACQMPIQISKPRFVNVDRILYEANT